MKTLVLVILACIGFYANGYSQTVTFSGKNVAFSNVFAAIKSQTGYVFFHDADLLREAKPEVCRCFATKELKVLIVKIKQYFTPLQLQT
jgi:hypothetical protein